MPKARFKGVDSFVDVFHIGKSKTLLNSSLRLGT